MALSKLETLGSSYEDINGGAHRKAASLIGVPALVRHIGLWNIGYDRSGAQTDKGLSPEERAARFRSYVDDLARHIKSNALGSIEFSAADKVHCLDAEVRAGTLWLISFWWQGIRASVRLEQHTEYTTLTSILDLSIVAKPFKPAIKGQRNYQSRLRGAFNRLAQLFEQTGEPGDDAEYRRIAFLQNKVWRAFEEEVIDAPVNHVPMLEIRLGAVFADFRGMVTGSRPTWKDDEPHSFYQPFRCPTDRPRTDYISREEIDPLWPRRVLKRLWPLIQAEERLREFEFTASGFLDSRVVYVSALGPRAEAKLAPDWDWTPIYFYLHSSTDDPWQIGRLINRLHALGCFRLASTIGIKTLMAAGTTPDDLGTAIDGAVNAIRRAMQALGRNEAPPPFASPRRWLRLPFFRADAARGVKREPGTALSDGENAEAERNTAPRNAAPEDSAATVEAAENRDRCGVAEPDMAVAEVQRQYQELPAGLFHRLERSNYYIEQFTREAGALREKRIEGFQKYEEFVSRRLSGIFSYINLLGKRMKDIDTRVSNLGRSYAAFKTAETTCRIDALVREMSKQENEIRKIQDFGEIALIGFLIPYYMGTMLIKNVLHFDEGSEPRLLWPILMSVFALIVLFKRAPKVDDSGGQIGIHEASAERRRRRRRTSLLLAYVVVIWVCYAVAVRTHDAVDPPGRISDRADRGTSTDRH